MNLHLHDVRKSFAWFACGAIVLGPMGLALDQSPEPGRAPVSGRITIEGRPVRDAVICFDAEVGDHLGYGSVHPDGTYQLKNRCVGDGVPPGRYKVHVYSYALGPMLPGKYQESRTSGIEVQVGPDWNQFDFDLR